MNSNAGPGPVRASSGQPVTGILPLLLACFVLATVSLGEPAVADSIYMKTGTVIRTARATIDGDAVVFEQYGNRVAIPLELVERVVPDDHTGPVSVTRNESRRASSAGRSSTDTGEAATPVRSVGPTASGNDVPVEETEEYWQGRVRALHQEGELLTARLQEQRRIERAFLFSHRSTADTRRRIEELRQAIENNEQARRDLRRAARRKNIPPGWLRVPGITY